MAEQQHEIDPLISVLRDMRGSTKQVDAAREIGFSQSMLSSYESGRVSPKLSDLRLWVKWLGADLAVIQAGFNKPVDDTVEFRLTKYQAALAMGMLLAHAGSKDSQTSDDLREIADIMVRSLR